MHILIDSGSYHALNLGDVAMLQAAVSRLRELWPGASIAAVTNSPPALALHCPGVRPVPLAGRIAFRTDRWLGRADRLLPPRLRARFNAFHDRIRRRWPATLAAVIGGKRMVAFRRDCFAALTYVQAVKRADLVIMSGAGVFTDAFAENANGVLDTLELAADWGVTTAAFGQGMGPVSAGALRRRMSEVLPRLALIALRERPEVSACWTLSVSTRNGSSSPGTMPSRWRTTASGRKQAARSASTCGWQAMPASPHQVWTQSAPRSGARRIGWPSQ